MQHKSKNAGAWYRCNRLVVKHADVKAAINNNVDAHTAFTAMQSIISEIATSVGIPVPVIPQNLMPCSLAFWEGRLSYDSFTKSTVKGSPRYVSDHGKAFRQHAKEFRDAVRGVIDAMAMSDDLTQKEGGAFNPGGVAGAKISV